MPDEFLWMRHDGTGGAARLPAAAREGWEDLGWREAAADEIPAEPNPVLAEYRPLTAPTPVEPPSISDDTTDDDDSADPAPRTRRSRRETKE